MAHMNGINKAIKKAGGRRQLAEALGVKRQHVEYWLKSGVPPKRAVQIEQVTGVKRKELCPELYA